MNARDPAHGACHDERQAGVASLLHATPWFVALPPKEQAALLVESREIHASARQCVIHAGESPKGWFCVIEGMLKWTSINQDGRSLSIAALSAGSWFGEAAMVRGQAYDHHVFALRHSRLLLIPSEACERLLRHDAVFSLAVMHHLAERVNFLMAMVAVNGLADIEVKVARTLASMFHRHLHPRTQACLRLSQEQLANFCGVSRQRCNVVLKRLQSMELIALGYSGITILDLEGLRHFSNASARLPAL